MTIAQLIERLQTFEDKNMEVVLHNNEWGTYDRVEDLFELQNYLVISDLREEEFRGWRYRPGQKISGELVERSYPNE